MGASNWLQPSLIFAVACFILWTMRRAAGRLAPKVGLGTIFFLVTRWPVLGAWALGTIGMGIILYRDIVSNGVEPNVPLIALLSLFCGLGVAPPLVGIPFCLVRAFAPAPALSLEPGEAVLFERLGSHFLNGEGRGGRLVVTNRRLGFKPHRFNVQLATWSVRLEEIQSLEREGDRFIIVKSAAGRPEWVATMYAKDVVTYLDALRAKPEPERSGASEEALRAVGFR